MRSKKGISLITLAITILVMAILTTVIIMTTNNSGIIKNSKNTVSATNLQQVQELAQVAWTNAQIEGKETVEELEQAINDSLTQSGVDITKYDITVTENGVTVTAKAGSVIIPPATDSDDENTEITPTTGLSAIDIAATPSTYYGEMVEYNSAISETTWQIFHSDGANIYLIAAEAVKNTDLPYKNGAGPISSTTNSYTASIADYADDGVFLSSGGYTGSEDITDPDMIALNSEYHAWLNANNQINTNPNMKAVAYMLDKDIWTAKFGDGTSKTKYVIGGPTIELFFDAYKAKTGVEHTYTITSYGYDVAVSGISGSPFVFDYEYWIASAPGGEIEEDYVLSIVQGMVYKDDYTCYKAFRPIVCLEANTRLEKVGDSFQIK